MASKSENEESPWPYLNSMFRCISTQDKTYKFLCLLCAPKHKEVSAYSNSASNLRKHVEVIKVIYLYLN